MCFVIFMFTKFQRIYCHLIQETVGAIHRSVSGFKFPQRYLVGAVAIAFGRLRNEKGKIVEKSTRIYSFLLTLLIHLLIHLYIFTFLFLDLPALWA